MLAGGAVGQEAAPDAGSAAAPEKTARPAEKPGRQEAGVLTVYHLKYAQAGSIAETLAEVMEGKELRASFVAEKRLNAIIVQAPREAHDEVKQLIEVLDVPAAADTARKGAKQDGDASVRTTVFYYLKEAKATSVAKVLSAAMSDVKGVKIVADERVNGLVVSASREQQDQLAELIDKLNGEGAPDEKPVVEVFPLKYVAPQSAAELVSDLYRQVKSMRIAADASSGSVVVYAPADKAREIGALLSRLDVPHESDSARELKIFAMIHAAAEEAARVLGEVLSDAKVSVDSQSNCVLVEAPPDGIRRAEEVLARLDTEAERDPQKLRPGATFRVRVVWLASGLSGDAAEPAEDLKDVVGELSKVGVKDLGQVGQMIVNTTPDGHFEINCAPIVGQRTSDLEISGQLEGQQEKPTLKVELSASQTEMEPVATRGPVRRTSKRLVELQTSIAAPLGHYVVLGVAPVEKMTSVFVVQVTAGKP